MNILVLSKRQYMNKDLIDDRYGRFRELPLALAGLGHKVTGICLSYRTRDEGRRDDVTQVARVDWYSLNLKRLLPWGEMSYWHTIDSIAGDFRPDLAWACSDAPHAIIGVHIAKKIGAPLVIDLYDNFESFSITRLPGVTSMFRRALRSADGITCVSHPLARYVKQTSACKCPVEVIENAVPEGIFSPMDRASARRELGLPQDGIFIGTAGAISSSRGIETLFRAFENLTLRRPDVHLVLSGPCDKGLKLPQSPKVHYLGILPTQTVPTFLSALDISVICNRDSAFGRYCFPQKFYESVACGVPVVAAATGAMLELLEDMPEILFEPDNADSLTHVLHGQIANPLSVTLKAPSWMDLGKQLENFFSFIKKGR
jgi:glycosyltransferase involved in cell wall biosynthesis